MKNKKNSVHCIKQIVRQHVLNRAETAGPDGNRSIAPTYRGLSAVSSDLLDTADKPRYVGVLSKDKKTDGQKTLDLSKVDQPLFNHLVREHRLEFIVNQYAMTATEQSGALLLVRRQLRMRQHLLELKNLFNKHQIDHVVLKGIPLNTQLYGDQCFRIANDLDVLIHEKNLLMAHQCLVQAGFQPSWPLKALPFKGDNTPGLIENIAYYVRWFKDLTYTHPLWICRLELHWKLTTLPVLKASPLVQNTMTPCFIAAKQSVLVCEDHINFLFLCVHGANHKWQRLQWLIDVAVFYQKKSVDWNKIVSLAQQYHSIRPLLETALLLQEEYQLAVPSVPHSALDWISVRYRLRYIRKLWGNPIISMTESIFYDLLLCSSWMSKGRYFCRLVLSSRKSLEQLSKYPDRAVWKIVLISVYKRLTFQR